VQSSEAIAYVTPAIANTLEPGAILKNLSRPQFAEGDCFALNHGLAMTPFSFQLASPRLAARRYASAQSFRR
jgi:hypothetical protein